VTLQSASQGRARAWFAGDSLRVSPLASGQPFHEGTTAIGNFFQRAGAKTRPDAGDTPTRSLHSAAMKDYPGRLNLFQVTMLDWREHHPYNAVHAAQILQPLDTAALAGAIDAELTHAGLTGLALDGAHGRYVWRGGPSQVTLETIEPGADWQASLAQAFERHLNAPFVHEGAIDPFRFFVMPVENAFFLGLAYDHFIAGGDSIVVLLNAIADRYAGKPVPATSMRLYPRTHAHLFLRHPLHFLRGLTRFPALARSCRRTLRPRYRSIEDGHNGFLFFWIEAAHYAALRAAAKGWRVTLNDALMALLLLAQDAAMPARDMNKHRHELAVASIINLRRAHGEDTRTTFGQFLSSFRVSHPVPPGIRLDELAGDVHRATTRIKREKLFLTTLFAMAIDRAIGRWQTPAQRIGIYAKNYPVGAGVSLLNVDALWQSHPDARTPVYMRGVPTGPLSPIVAAVTTSGGRMCIGLSYRTTSVTREEAARIGNDLVTRISALP
jgi:hypothetical protein